MLKTSRAQALAFVATLALGACGKKDYGNTSAVSGATDTTIASTQPAQPAHHSVLGGAVAGAAAGHVLGRHAVAGAAVGALIQHERNKQAAARR